MRRLILLLLLLSLFSFSFTYGDIVNEFWPADHVPPKSAILPDFHNNVVQVSVILPNLTRFHVDEKKTYINLDMAIEKVVPGIMLGFEEAKQRGLIDDLYFNVTLRDSRCSIIYGPKVMTDAILDGVNVVFGPSCEFCLAPVGRMLRFYNLPLLTAGALANDFVQPKTNQNEEYHLLVKTGFSFRDFVKTIFGIFEKFNWKKVKLAYEKNAHIAWSGSNTCSMFMSAIIELAKIRSIATEEIKLDLHRTNDTESMETLIKDQLDDFANIFLGPVCPYVLAPVARYSGVWMKPILTTGGQANTFRNKNQYPLLTTVGGTYNQFAVFFQKLLKQFGWNIVSFLFHTYPETSGKGRSECQFTLGEVYMQMGGVKNLNLTYEAFNEEIVNVTGFQDILRGVMQRARVVILCASPTKVRDILLAAEGLGLMERGEYVFFNVELFASRNLANYKPWHQPDRPEEENWRALKAFESVLTVTASSSADNSQYEDFAQEVKALSRSKFGYEYNEEVNSFVANFHDAVLLYATALKETIEEYGIDAKSKGELIVKKMWNRTISGVTGNVSINDNGDRSADYALLDLDPNKQEFKVVAVYRGRTNAFELNGTDLIHWPNRKGLGPPRDQPECGFDGSLCEKKSLLLYILLGTFTVAFIILLVFSFFIYRYSRRVVLQQGQT